MPNNIRMVGRYITDKDKKVIESLLDIAGITINGPRDYDIQIHNPDFYGRILKQGVLGLGESYMDGWWDCPKLDIFFSKVIAADLEKHITKDLNTMLRVASKHIINDGRKSKAFNIGEKHYDIGNDLYRAMLDKRLTYTCGYFQDTNNLDKAQEAKLDLICKKIGVKKGQTVLDIGSGWGSFIKYAAEKYGAETLGVTVSKEQKKLADELCDGLSAKTRLQDYRNIDEKFDHIVSIGMFEHVGLKNYRDFLKIVHKSLNDDGLFLLHTIGAINSKNEVNTWIDKYIFPGGMLPSIQQISKSIEGLFIIEDLHNFGAYYDNTLMAWHKNFENNWDKIKLNYDERFHRMWRYYLLSCAAGFRTRNLQLWQIVLSKNGVPGGYKSIR